VIVLEGVQVMPSSGGKPFTAYVLQFIDINGKKRNTARRFREILGFHEELKKVFPFAPIPPFPGKKIVGNLKSDFVERRRADLQLYFEFIVSIEEVPSSEQFLAYFDS